MTFQKGNKLAQEWTLENATERFYDALDFAESSEECLCLQDAIYHSGIPYSTFDYLSDNHSVLGLIKRNIRQAVIRRINKESLKGEFAAAPAIWRQKQLGEKDQQYIDQNNKNESTIKLEVQSDEDKKTIEDLKNKFNRE